MLLRAGVGSSLQQGMGCCGVPALPSSRQRDSQGAPAGDGPLLVQMEVGRDTGNVWGDEPGGEPAGRSTEAAPCGVISLCINKEDFLLPQQGKLPLEKWGAELPWLLSPWDPLVPPKLWLCQCPAHSSARAPGT